MTVGETGVSWSLSEFGDMMDSEIIQWYKDFVGNLTERSEALQAEINKHKGGG